MAHGSQIAAAKAVPPFCRFTADGLAVTVRAAPRSSRPGIDGVAGDALRVRVKSAPVDGKANRELAETLARALGLPKSSVSLKSGETSKNKIFVLRGVKTVPPELSAAAGG